MFVLGSLLIAAPGAAIRSSYPRPLHALVAAALVAALAAPAGATHLEAKMYGVDDWTDECTGGDRSWSNMVDRWYDEMDDHGWYHKDGRFVDDGMDIKPFCDPDTGIAGCTDGTRMDDGDAVMIFMHGSDNGDAWRGKVRHEHPDNGCFINAPGSNGGDELFAGDVDMEFLHLSSCYSLNADNLPDAWRMFYDPVDTPNNQRRLHQADGFHGVMWIASRIRQSYEDFAADAFSVSIKDAWMTNLYRNDIGDDGDEEQCPVAYAVGSNRDDCFNRIQNERYNNIFSDPSSIGYYCYYFFDGCDPPSEDPFEDPNAR